MPKPGSGRTEMDRDELLVVWAITGDRSLYSFKIKRAVENCVARRLEAACPKQTVPHGLVGVPALYSIMREEDRLLAITALIAHIDIHLARENGKSCLHPPLRGLGAGLLLRWMTPVAGVIRFPTLVGPRLKRCVNPIGKRRGL